MLVLVWMAPVFAILWVLAFLFFLVLEMLVPGGFCYACLALGALAAAMAAWLQAGPAWVWVVFLATSSLGVFIAAPLARRWLRRIPLRPVGYDALCGQQAQVTERIEPRTGRGEVQLNLGGLWLASSETPIAAGTWVEVVGVAGAHLLVRALPEALPSKE